MRDEKKSKHYPGSFGAYLTEVPCQEAKSEGERHELPDDVFTPTPDHGKKAKEL